MAQKLNIKDVLNKGKETVVATFEEADKKKGGRPRKEEGLSKKNKVTIYLDSNEEELLKNAASEIGLSVGLYVKAMALRIAKKESILNS